MLDRVTLLESVMRGFALGMSIITLAPFVGTLPVLQLLGLFQLPSTLEIQATESVGTLRLVNCKLKGDTKLLPAMSAMISGLIVSWYSLR